MRRRRLLGDRRRGARCTRSVRRREVRAVHRARGCLGLGLSLSLRLGLSLRLYEGLCARLRLRLRLSLYQLCRREAAVCQGHRVGQALLLGYTDLRPDLRDLRCLLLRYSICDRPRRPAGRWLLRLLLLPRLLLLLLKQLRLLSLLRLLS